MDNHDSKKNSRIIVRIDTDLAEMIPGYLANRYKDVEAIQEALKVSDYMTIRIAGHSMKGSGGGYGFDAITEYGGALELEAKNRDNEGVKKTIVELKRFLDLVEVIYEDFG